MTTWSSTSNGFAEPALLSRLKDEASSTVAGMPNFSSISCAHCFRSVAGTITRMRRRRSAQRCAMTSPASMVLPSPTSSANRTPLDRGDRTANRAAST